MEHKKGARPNWTLVSSLETRIAELERFIQENTDEQLKRKFDEQLDGTSMLVRDCDLWREKYQELKREYDDRVRNLNGECAILEMSNKSMETGLESERKQREKAVEDYRKALDEINALKRRTLWQRILNK